MTSTVPPIYFRTASGFRRWLDKHHETARELWVGFYRKHSGKRGIQYSEAVDQALCYGWIDGVKKRVDADAYMHRFSPRRPTSVWSSANVTRVGELKRLRIMHPSGLQAFERRDPELSGIYSFENRPKSLARALDRRFRAHRKAWTFFQAQPPGYRGLMIFWIMSAKQAPTRARRLEQLIAASEKGQRRRL